MKRLAKKKKINLKVLLVCLLITYLVAGLGSIFTSTKTSSSWYQSIKPSITPPNWVFPIVWNILFFLIAYSMYLAFTNTKDKTEKKKILSLFGANFLFNILWSILYFGFESPIVGFIDLIILWIFTFILILRLKPLNKPASLLLVPYLLWLTFAGLLNLLSAL